MGKMVKFEDILNAEYNDHKLLNTSSFKSTAEFEQCFDTKYEIVDANVYIFDLYYHIYYIDHDVSLMWSIKYICSVKIKQANDNMYIILSYTDIMHLIDIYKEHLTFDIQLFGKIFEMFKDYRDVLTGLFVGIPREYWLNYQAPDKSIISYRNAKIMRLRYLGYTYQQIGNENGITSTRVAQIVKRVEREATRLCMYKGNLNNNHIEYLKLPRNIEFALKRFGIDTIDKLEDAINDKSINRVRNVGKKSIEKINDALNKYNNKEV